MRAFEEFFNKYWRFIVGSALLLNAIVDWQQSELIAHIVKVLGE